MMYGSELALRPHGRVIALALQILGTYDLGARLRYAAVARLLRTLSAPRTILDIGSGEGLLSFAMLRRWPQTTVVGIDIDRSRNDDATQLARRAGLGDRVTFVHPDERPRGTQYDLVTCVDVMEHVADDVGFARDIADSTNPSGAAVIHVPGLDKRRFMREFPEQSDHVRPGYSITGLPDVLRAAGFQTVKAWPTFGPAGSLAWEGFQLARSGSLPARAFLPVWYALAACDAAIIPERGNGVVAIARRA